jgi:hypothetical protein
MAPVGMRLVFFLPAGTSAYWQGWACIVLLCVPMTLVVRYLFRNDPALLERRLSQKESEEERKLSVKPGNPLEFAPHVPGGLAVRLWHVALGPEGRRAALTSLRLQPATVF